MFGKNPVRKQDLSSPLDLYVQEIFSTIQGEGPFAGTPAIFIRLAGCNLTCSFCDTEFEQGMEEQMSLGAVMAAVQAIPKFFKLVVITGGEPMRQNILKLVGVLTGMGKLVQIETSGTLWVPGIEYYIHTGDLTIVCSPKTGRVHPEVRRYCHDWKYIISTEDVFSEKDGLPLSTVGRWGEPTKSPLARPSPCEKVWLQPCDVQDDAKNAANIKKAAALALEYGYNLCLQIHKIVGLP